ncbi:YozQ family protein [Paenibacillus sp. GD4]|uniref:YozQ family protein n=1 Tax=Paenibacillus sp. GD4 TaxID=3068890 RepID=UPI002796B5EE|nr:YozQ family protein [Paenibacillus sp. GD4]MDQ1913080.1 YozQ family protein [Paenibacillus sp. GD4]
MNKQDPAAESLQQNADAVASHKYEVSDYQNESPLSKGLAETHEQFSDVYAAGLSSGIVELEQGKSYRIPDGGYEENRQPETRP